MARRLGGLIVVLLVLTCVAGRAEAARERPRTQRVASESKGLWSAVWDRVVAAVVGPVASGAAAPADGTDAGLQMDPNGSIPATTAPKP